MRSKSLFEKLSAQPYILWSAIFIVAPLIMVAYYAFTDRNGNFTWDNIASIGDYTGVFMLSVLFGIIATAICLVIAYPFAYAIVQTKMKTQRTLYLLVMLPMWMNFLIRTYSWMTILGETGVINTFLGWFGIGPFKMLNTGGAVILGMVYNFLPYMVLPIYTVMAKMDKSLIEAAQDLGCNKFSVIKNVVMPLSVPGIISGVTMVFVPSVSTFYISQKLGGGQVTLIGDIIEMQFQSANNYNLGASLSFVLMILILVCLALMNHFTDEDNGGAMYI